MGLDLTEGKTFDKVDFSVAPFVKGEYEDCVFDNCDLSNVNLSGSRFGECRFIGCNLSMAKLGDTVLRDVVFKDCKMLGLQFGHCSGFGLAFSFEGCILDHSSFYKLKVKKTIFKNCSLQEVDFTEADLSESYFGDCDLNKAVFESTLLEKADLRTAINYSINPEINKLKKGKFSLPGVLGLLDKYDIQIEH